MSAQPFEYPIAGEMIIGGERLRPAYLRPLPGPLEQFEPTLVSTSVTHETIIDDHPGVVALGEMVVADSRPKIEATRKVEKAWASTKMTREVGRVALLAAEGIVPPEAPGVIEEARRDFETATGENLKGDKKLGNWLFFEPERELPFVNGCTRMKNGESLADVVHNGTEEYRRKAEHDPAFRPQVVRNEGDEIVMSVVNDLGVGEMAFLLSMDPKEQLKKDNKFWEQEMHYAEGMAVVQVYFRADVDTMIACAYSIDKSDKAKLSQLLAGYGLEVPADLHADLWHRHIARREASREEAMDFGPKLRNEYRDMIGEAGELISVTKLIEANKELVDHYFDNLVVPLGEATVTGKNNDVMANFARALLKNARLFDADTRRQLLHIANSRSFSEADSVFMEGKIRYALVEELRTIVEQMVRVETIRQNRVQESAPIVYHQVSVQYATQLDIGNRAAGFVHVGTEAGRFYPGCPGAGLGSNKADSETPFSILNGPQDVFGGRAGAEESGNKEEANIPNRLRCPKCKVESPRSEVVKADCWRCPNPKCKYEVDICTGESKGGGGEERKKPDSPKAGSADASPKPDARHDEPRGEQDTSKPADDVVSHVTGDDSAGAEVVELDAYRERAGNHAPVEPQNLTGKVLLFAR